MDIKQLNRQHFESNEWLHNYYKNVRLLKYNTDLDLYRKNIQTLKPDLIIELGTLQGGSARFFRDLCPNVITVDIEKQTDIEFDDITYIIADSTGPIVDHLKDLAKDYKCVMVVLDSDHKKKHVLKELELYAPLVTEGSYIIVEDTFLGEYMDDPDSPKQAVEEFLEHHTEFEVEPMNITLTMNPNGWLKKTKR